ncbi:DUF177 domain-containing protein [Paenibacillus sp. ACRRX]|uniref:YceD family protein n=1 Tax=unclassified Paenibacillus TaxID=185978 RepID=UPI001EF5BE05|nr:MULTISPECIES: DUF177 domain-containing protein [unclassified Paenibacillus]MCG7407545.1 DUF177 domain-containing protein [Paenibacillus sp. ACRRX]MDK8180780.1 DUF177 domain-containing protein [Paenibacillus sp. UMB4589-SE434]
MNFSFRDTIKGHKVHIHDTFRADEVIKGRSDIRHIEPVDVDLTAVSESDDRIGVSGQLKANLGIVCSRCLTPHTETVVIPFHEQFKLTDSTDLPTDDEDDVITLTDDRVDLTPYVEEAVFVHLPYAPLCREDCQGLCPTCGSNRNDNPCGCSNERIDPRLAGLKDFFKK